MQTTKVDLPITITGRHVSVTDSMREHAEKKISQLNFDYPKVIDAKVLLDVEKDRHKAEIILHCANHIVIEADSTTPNMYSAIDETIHKVARQMRKQKTRMLKSHRPDRSTLRKLKEGPVDMDTGLVEALDEQQPDYYEDLPFLLHRETASLKKLTEDEAVEALELSDRPVIVYSDARSEKVSVLYRREDGDYGVICPANHS
ncbi:MAG: ribosome-associated translation inhibitor RaiA [Verrucomicrobiales bacterium]|nr:ribosome-associated translation inhibitor RaiA [Verrucomicrobiales bacterium]